jgi:hypothetical protein
MGNIPASIGKWVISHFNFATNSPSRYTPHRKPAGWRVGEAGGAFDRVGGRSISSGICGRRLYCRAAYSFMGGSAGQGNSV